MSIKPATKTIWALILAAFLIGLGLMAAGMAMGGFTPIGLGPAGMRFYDFREGIVYDSRLEPISSGQMTTESATVYEDINRITVTSVAAAIRIVPTDDDYLSYAVTMPEDRWTYRISTDGGELRIEHRQNRGSFVIFGLSGLGRNQDVGEIVINVPSEMSFNSVSLANVSGSIDMPIDMQVDDLTIDTVAGRVSIDGLNLEDESDRGTRLAITSISGDVTVRESNLSGLDLSLISGNADIGIRGLDDFNVSSSSISGTVTVGDAALSGMGATDIVSAGHNNITIETISGNVTLNSVDSRD